LKHFDLLDHNRVLVSEGPMSINGKPVYVYLFNDVIFLCREKKNIKEGYRVISLQLSVLNDIEPVKEGKIDANYYDVIFYFGSLRF
jgi:hypothetical protein